MYSILVKHSFVASHALSAAGRVFEPLHEHEWDVEVEIASSGLDDSGCVVDFVWFDEIISKILASYENRDMGALPRFAGRSPSAEVIAEALHGDIERALDGKAVRVGRVTVWEDGRHAGAYGGLR
jgi:6-pyruvoyltetrahydropterin/6-carboxytetrahydropterin synthase